MINGTVKWFNDEKGYGFVEANGKDYFLHYKEIQLNGFRKAVQGDKVTFEPGSSPKGLVAKTVIICPDI